MQHIVAIGTDGNKVCFGVELVGFADGRDWNKVMNVDEALAYFAVGLLKVEATDSTTTTFGGNAGITRLTTAFITIQHNLVYLTFRIFCNESPLPAFPKGEGCCPFAF